MSNSAGANPIVIDTEDTAATAVSAIRHKITGICVRASADNWVVTLHDASGGNKIFDLESKITNDRGGFYPLKLAVTGIFATTLTNITNVLVYTDGVPA